MVSTAYPLTRELQLTPDHTRARNSPYSRIVAVPGGTEWVGASRRALAAPGVDVNLERKTTTRTL